MIAILIFNICGCAQTAEETLIAEPETVESDCAEIESGEEADVADAEAGSAEQADPIYIIQPQLTQADTYEMEDWQAAYAEYIEDFEWKESAKYSLIYVDEDDIPELLIDDAGGESYGCLILTFHNGETDLLHTWRRGFTYIEKENLLNNSSGIMGHYYDRIWSIENGKWVYVTGGEWFMTMGDDDQEYFDYQWDGEPVEEEEYEDKLDEVFNSELAKEPEQYERLDEILFRLKTGTAVSQTHRYELYVEDITWDEAKRRCEEKGGYLAAITTTEEYEYIKNGIEDSGQTQVAYWVGADGEPSYFKQAADEQIDELGIYLLYDDVKEDCYLYDAPMDMLIRNPEYEGKIGYICEYDPVMVMSKYTFYNVYGSMSYWDEFEYDSAGNMIKDVAYRSGHDSIWHWYKYEYDSAGNRTKEIHYGVEGGGDWRFEYEYDSAGNRTKEIHFTADGRADWWKEYEYDSAGKLMRRTLYEADGSVDWWDEREYDGSGNVVQIIIYDTNDIIERYEYKYDSTGNLTKEIKYEGDGSIIYRKEYEYDSSGKRIKEVRYDSDLVVEEREWEYDYMGNSTKLTVNRLGEGSEWYEYEYITITPH